jgi:inositol 1,4,5-triphosphate receptor type 3
MGYLSEESKVSFLETVGRDSANDKVNGLLDEVSGFFMEMSYFLRLRRLGLRYNNNVLVYLRNFCLGVALVINVLVIAGDDASAGAARVLGILAVILYSSILLLWLIFRM